MPLHGADDGFHVGFAQDGKAVALHPQPVGPQLDLPLRFLPRDIQDRHLPPHVLADLEQQGGFADPRIAADEHQRAPDDTAPQYPVELGQPGAGALFPFGMDIPKGADIRRPAGGRAGCGRPLGGAYLLGQGIPLPAGRAFPAPAGGFEAAARADIYGFRFRCHASLSFRFYIRVTARTAGFPPRRQTPSGAGNPDP